MANRFLETNYYKSPFVRGLKGPMKALYSFIICDCTAAGIWLKDFEAASMYIGFQFTEEEFSENFIKKDKAFDLGNGKIFFPDFIEHQYPSGLQSDNKAHKNIIFDLDKLNFLTEKIIEKKVGNITKSVTIFYVKNKGALKGLLSPPIGVQGNGNGNGNGNTSPFGENFIIPQMVQLWYQIFPTQVEDRANDYNGMGKILPLIMKHLKIKTFENNHEKIFEVVRQVGEQIQGEKSNFWVNKPIKTVANSFQVFLNELSNPVKKNGQQQFTSSATQHTEQIDQLNDIYAKAATVIEGKHRRNSGNNSGKV